MKILFTGGGSGGHVFPVIAIIREIKKLIPEADLLYVGPHDEWVGLYLSQEDIRSKYILSGKIRRYLGLKEIVLNIRDLFQLVIGFFQSFKIIWKESPELIFSKGGFGSIPVVLTAKILKIPVFMHESDASPGVSNRITAKFALKIFVSFENTEYLEPEKMIVVGNPVRREITGGSKETAKKMFNLTGKKYVLLILGGSQGAQRINDMLLLIFQDLLKDFEIIHQTGSKNFEAVKKESKVVIPKDLQAFYHPYPFLKETELKQAYAIADLVVGRAGSGTIFNNAINSKPSILIPLPESAQNHQSKNAFKYSQSGACIVIEEANLTPQFFMERVNFLFSRPKDLEKMSRAAKEFSKPTAARKIAKYILEFVMS